MVGVEGLDQEPGLHTQTQCGVIRVIKGRGGTWPADTVWRKLLQCGN